MPNWCEGTLKVRGSFENVRNFILNGLSEPDTAFLIRKPEEPFLKIWDDTENCFEAEIRRTCYINGTRRGFIEESYLDIYKEDDCSILLLNAKFAWDILAEQLWEICKEFSIDMKITAFERGAECVRDVEVVNGEITCNKATTYDDYQWECPCPLMGG